MEKTTRIIFGAAVCVAVLIATTQPAVAGIDNGNFENGLSEWDTSGTVWVAGGVAVLSEYEYGPSVLSQSFMLSGGEDTISFWFLIDTVGGGDTDTFTAKIDSETPFCSIDSDSDLIVNGRYETTIMYDVSHLDHNVSHTLEFCLIHDLVDGIPTCIVLDNVEPSNTPPIVPVPGALLLGGLGSALVVLLRKYV
jgi:hypothetical protein